jgi:tRNA(fMet)-specific endonuclease VapC
MRGSRRLEGTIEALVEVVPVVEFSAAAADKAGALRAALDIAGKTIGVMDSLIAANAIAEGCTLVTNNTAHFSRIDGLQIVNWIA